MFENFIGRKCIIRSSASGVWHGTVEHAELSGGFAVVRLSGGRRLWRWEGKALDCAGLAIHGPRTARIAGALAGPNIVANVCEINVCSDAASAAIEAVEPWNG